QVFADSIIPNFYVVYFLYWKDQHALFFILLNDDCPRISTWIILMRAISMGRNQRSERTHD
ncbi:hypothetical protein, partial [Aggregatibacter actinomycetemcomitans]|uniref:hypothetical protein n=1 Tax=Aggregatibacter actinomycetemcomitans TaxID=714 RepID=UPI001EE23AC3